MSSNYNDRLHRVLVKQQSSAGHSVSGSSNASSSVTSLSSGKRLSSASVGSAVSSPSNMTRTARKNSTVSFDSAAAMSDASSNHSSRRLFASSTPSNVQMSAPLMFTTHDLMSPEYKPQLTRTKSSPKTKTDAPAPLQDLTLRDLTLEDDPDHSSIYAASTPRPQAIDASKTFNDIFNVSSDQTPTLQTPTLQTPTGGPDSDAEFDDSPASIQQQADMDSRLRNFYSENGIVIRDNTSNGFSNGLQGQFPFSTYDHNEPIPVDDTGIGMGKLYSEIQVQELDTVNEQDDDEAYYTETSEAYQKCHRPMPDLDFDLDQVIQQAVAISARAPSPKLMHSKSVSSATAGAHSLARSRSRSGSRDMTSPVGGSRLSSGSQHSSYMTPTNATSPRSHALRRDYNLPKVNLNESLQEKINESNAAVHISSQKNYGGVTKLTSGMSSGMKRLVRKISMS